MQNMQNAKIQIKGFFDKLQQQLCIHKWRQIDSFVTMQSDMSALAVQSFECDICKNRRVDEEIVK